MDAQNLNIKNLIKINEINSKDNKNLNFAFLFKKRINKKFRINEKIIPSFLIQMIKFKLKKNKTKFLIWDLFSYKIKNKYFEQISKKEKIKISWYPLRCQ